MAIVLDDNGEWCSVGESRPVDFDAYLLRRHGPGGNLSDRQREILAVIGSRPLVEVNTDGTRQEQPAGWHATESLSHDRTSPTGRRIGWRTIVRRLAEGKRVKLAYGWTIYLG